MINPKGYYRLPLDPKLIGWFDASRLLGNNVALPANGSPLSIWYDLSGYYDNPIQSTVANQGEFRTNIANGLPGCHFSSSSGSAANGDWVRRATGSILGTGPYAANAFTIFVAAQIDNLTPASGNIGCFVFNQGSVAGSNQQYQFHQVASGGIVCESQDTSGGVRTCSGLGNVAINTPFVTSFYTNSVAYGTVDGLKARLDTNAEVSCNSSFSGVSGGSGANGFNIGKQKDGQGNRQFDGYVFEVLVYATELTANQRLKIQQYLASKWGAPYPNS